MDLLGSHGGVEPAAATSNVGADQTAVLIIGPPHEVMALCSSGTSMPFATAICSRQVLNSRNEILTWPWQQKWSGQLQFE